MAVARGFINLSTLTAGATHAVSGLAFAPTWFLLSVVGATSATDAITNATTHHSKRGFGFAVSTSSRRAFATQSFYGNTVMGADHAYRDDCVLSFLTHGLTSPPTDAGRVDVQSFDSGGFTLINDVALAQATQVEYICGDDPSRAIADLTEPSATGAASITGQSFQPACAIFGSVGRSAVGVGLDSRIMIGFAAGGGQYVLSCGSNDASGTSITKAYARDDECIAILPDTLANPTTMQTRASFTSFNSDGLTVNFSAILAGGGQKIPALLLAGRQYKLDTFVSSTTLNTQFARTGYGFAPLGGLFCSHSQAASTAGTAQDNDRWSVGTFTSPTNRGAQHMWDRHGVATGVILTAIEYDAVMVQVTSSATLAELIDVHTMDSGGITFIQDDAAVVANELMAVLAFGPAASGGTTYPTTHVGSLTPSAVVNFRFNKGFVGAVNPAGVVIRETRRSFVGVAAPAGVVVRQNRLDFVGALSPTAILATLKVTLRDFAGAFSPSGTVQNRVNKTFAGLATPTGVTNRQTTRSFAGQVTPEGTVSRQTRQTFVGSFSPTALLAAGKAVFLSFVGTITPSADVTTQSGATPPPTSIIVKSLAWLRRRRRRRG